MHTDYGAMLQALTYSQPRIPFISNIRGVASDQVATPDYWFHQVKQPVQLAEDMQTPQQFGCEIGLEISPSLPNSPASPAATTDILSTTRNWLPSLKPGQGEWQTMLHSLAQMYVQGVAVNWSGFEQDYSCRKVVLPTYPFQRQHYGIEIT